MTKAALINFLIAQRKAKKFLEVSMHDLQSNFLSINCPDKTASFPNTSDDFFLNNKEKFDMVFIDGLHTEEQVSKDLANALTCLNKNGIIILHDCMPPDTWHQREFEYYKEGEAWNGTVWKAALRFFNETNLRCILLDTDWGCAVIDSAQSQVPLCFKLPSALNYEIHYPVFLQYKKSVYDFLREQIKVFYHLACMGNWQEVFEEQMKQLCENGFKHISLTVLGKPEDVHVANSICENYKLFVRTIFQDPSLEYYETPALMAIEEYVRDNDGYILYLHSKGVSSPSDNNKMKWRRLMMRELVDNWENCMRQLPSYDVIGVNWREMPPVSHFSGNFWYASANYLRKLANFKYYYDNPHYNIWDRFEYKRLGCEFWIGSGRDKPKILSLFCKNVDFSNSTYWR